jgi:hypothetical protein
VASSPSRAWIGPACWLRRGQGTTEEALQYGGVVRRGASRTRFPRPGCADAAGPGQQAWPDHRLVLGGQHRDSGAALDQCEACKTEPASTVCRSCPAPVLAAQAARVWRRIPRPSSPRRSRGYRASRSGHPVWFRAGMGFGQDRDQGLAGYDRPRSPILGRSRIGSRQRCRFVRRLRLGGLQSHERLAVQGHEQVDAQTVSM